MGLLITSLGVNNHTYIKHFGLVCFVGSGRNRERKRGRIVDTWHVHPGLFVCWRKSSSPSMLFADVAPSWQRKESGKKFFPSKIDLKTDLAHKSIQSINIL